MKELPTQIAHYRITAPLGRGSTGVVLSAEDERLGRAVALKLLPPDADPGAVERFTREAQAASALNHPSIVIVHDVGEWQGHAYIVMELVDGVRLSELAGRGVTAREAMRLCAEAADALGAAHARGILHRDIKSDNVMVTADGRVKVLDFGIAKLLDRSGASPSPPPEELSENASDSQKMAARARQADWPLGSAPNLANLTKLGDVLGTPAYMSPEQVDGKVVDARSEVFSLGVVLYELLVGRRPFHRAGIGFVPPAKREGALVLPSVAATSRGISPAVDALVASALEIDPEKRLPDMPTFAARLRELLEEPPPRRTRRRLLTTAAIVAFGGGAIAGTMILRNSATPPAATSGASPPARSPMVTATRRVTFEPGCEEYPSLSPDGRQVLFDAWTGEDYELVRMDLATGHRTLITHAPNWDYGAAVSPDGKRIAYLHLADRGVELRVLPWDGDRVAEPIILGLSETIPQWTSPNELLSGRVDGKVVRWRLEPGKAPEETVVASLPHGTQPYTFAALRDSVVVTLVPQHDVEAATLTRLNAGPIAQLLPNVIADNGLGAGKSGETLYAIRKSLAGTNEIAFLDLTRPGSEAQAIGNVADPGGGLTLSRDGKMLAYSTCAALFSIVRLEPGKPLAPFVATGPWEDRQAVSGAGGVAFVSNRGGKRQLWWQPTGSDRAKPLTGLGTEEGKLSPDGKSVVYVDRRQKGIFVLPRAGAEPIRVTASQTDAEPVFSADGGTIYFTRLQPDAGQQVMRVKIGDSKPTPVAPMDSSAPSLSPHGDALVYAQAGPDGTRLMHAKLDGSGAVPLTTPNTYGRTSFSADGQRLLALRNELEVLELDVARALGGELERAEKVLWTVTTESIQWVDYAPDGKGLIASVTHWNGDLWVAEGTFP